MVYIGSRDGNLYAIDALSGQPKWTFALGYTDSSPAVVDGVVYAGNSDNSLYAIDAATGQQIWALEIGGDISDALVSSPAAGDVVYVGSTDANLYAIDAASGQQIWAVTIGEIASSPAVVDDVVYVSTPDPSCCMPSTPERARKNGPTKTATLASAIAHLRPSPMARPTSSAMTTTIFMPSTPHPASRDGNSPFPSPNLRSTP